MNTIKFDEPLKLNGQPLTRKYLSTLDDRQRQDLIEPIYQLVRREISNFPFPDDDSQIKKEWKKLQDFRPQIDQTEVHNNSSLGTIICKYFCHSFYTATEFGKPTLIDNFNDDDLLRKIIFNRLGLGWYQEEPGEVFTLSPKMIFIQAQRSMRLVNATSMFKPNIAKYVCEKYSEPGDVVGDYSCGFGGRLLGAMACGRQYIGTDPLTTPELEKMAEFFKFEKYKLISKGSEDYCDKENSIDLYWSSPPYFNQEVYSSDKTQAYNNGEEYFYNVYWKNTLKNVQYMLKPGKWFGLNVKNYPKMLEMACNTFGDVQEEISLRTFRNHLTKSAGNSKLEYLYMFKNCK